MKCKMVQMDINSNFELFMEYECNSNKFHN